jgi:hypothetical protein
MQFAKTNWLVVSRQSSSNSDAEPEYAVPCLGNLTEEHYDTSRKVAGSSPY